MKLDKSVLRLDTLILFVPNVYVNINFVLYLLFGIFCILVTFVCITKKMDFSGLKNTKLKVMVCFLTF